MTLVLTSIAPGIQRGLRKPTWGWEGSTTEAPLRSVLPDVVEQRTRKGTPKWKNSSLVTDARGEEVREDKSRDQTAKLRHIVAATVGILKGRVLGIGAETNPMGISSVTPRGRSH